MDELKINTTKRTSGTKKFGRYKRKQ